MPSFRMPSFHAAATALAIAAAIAALAACSSATLTAAPTPAAPPASGSFEVTGVDYAFEGLPEDVAAGTTLTFRNDGTEVHEMVVMRRNDDLTKPFLEILGEGEEAGRTQVAVLGVAVAPPGQAAQSGVAVGDAGDYAVVCFIPVGTTPGGSGGPGGSGRSDGSGGPGASGAPGGPPHFVRGMITEFTVTE